MLLRLPETGAGAARDSLGSVARGWESKAVEAQQADELSKPAAKPALTPDEQERERHVATLRLALTEATTQLQAACRPAHRDMLAQRIAAIQEQLATALRPRAGA